MKEDEIIEFIKNTVKRKKKDVITGIGDDTAVLRYTKDEYLLLTVDCVVENVHFKIPPFTYYQIGKKAIAVNLSDIAAMGGIPLYALVSAGLPEGNKKIIEEILKGIEEMGEKYEFEIVGGNLTKSEVLFIDICIAGKVEKKYLKLRKGAKSGDLIYITGSLGAAQVKKQFNIEPRIKEARYLVKNFSVSSMIDISDGLSSDLIKLVKENNLGFKIFLEKIPVSEDARKISKTEEEAISHALNDGEDYELVFTVFQKYKNQIPEKINSTKITFIGEITEEKEYIGIYKGKRTNIISSGFDHFSNRVG